MVVNNQQNLFLKQLIDNEFQLIATLKSSPSIPAPDCHQIHSQVYLYLVKYLNVNTPHPFVLRQEDQIMNDVVHNHFKVMILAVINADAYSQLTTGDFATRLTVRLQQEVHHLMTERCNIKSSMLYLYAMVSQALNRLINTTYLNRTVLSLWHELQQILTAHPTAQQYPSLLMTAYLTDNTVQFKLADQTINVESTFLEWADNCTQNEVTSPVLQINLNKLGDLPAPLRLLQTQQLPDILAMEFVTLSTILIIRAAACVVGQDNVI